MERSLRLIRSDDVAVAKSELEARLVTLRNQRAQLMADIEGMGNGTAECAAALVSKKKRLKAIERQIAQAEVGLLAL